jgi:hypothetical protein
MGKHVIVDIVVVPRQQNFAHHIALISKVFEGAFGAKVVEAVYVGSGWT